MPQTDRVLILGLDGATWSVLDPMRRRGVMPNLDALLAQAAHGTLRSTIPPVTSAAWTTMMTGCGPARHGIFDHRHYDSASNRMKVNNSSRIKVPTIWQLLSDAGRPVVSLNVPSTYPPPRVRGWVVSGMDAPHYEAAVSGYPEFAARLKAEVPGYDLKFHWKKPPETVEEIADAATKTADLFYARAEAGWLADRLVPDWSALMVQFQNLDPFQHRAWRYLNVDATGIDHPAMNAEAERVMAGLDRAIGRLCELADRRGAATLVCSDHGFGCCLGRVHVNRVLIDGGVARMPGPIGRFRRRLTQAIEHGRMEGQKRSQPTARKSSFDVSIEAEFPFDWKRTLAFAPHQDTAAMVYLNTAARRSGAPLQTNRQIDDALEQTARVLEDALHPETGLRLFPQVVRTAEAYGVDPGREDYPDLIALPDESYWVRTKLTILSRGKAWVEPDPMLPGTHRPEGVVALRAPGVAPGRTIEANLRDVTPTILSLLGQPIPAHIEGRPLDCLGRESEPTRRQDPPASASVPAPHHAQFEYTAEEQAIIEQRLADLGYLE